LKLIATAPAQEKYSLWSDDLCFTIWLSDGQIGVWQMSDKHYMPEWLKPNGNN